MRIRTWLASLVLFVFLLAPSAASAQSMSVQQQIALLQQLLAQLMALQGQQGTTSSGATAIIGTVSSSDPYTVTFRYTMNQEQVCGGTYMLYFGDENYSAGEEPQYLSFPPSTCNSYSQETEHTYESAGTYTATLYRSTSSGKTFLQSTTVVVGDSSKVRTLTVSSVSGNKVKVKYKNLLKDSYIELFWLNPSKNRYESVVQKNVSRGGSGSKTITIPSGSPSGTYVASARKTGTDIIVDSDTFTVSGSSKLDCTLSSSHRYAEDGERVTVKWKSTGASYAAWDPGMTNYYGFPSDKLSTSGSYSFSMPSSQGKDGITIVMDVYDYYGETEMCRVDILHDFDDDDEDDDDNDSTSTAERGAMILGVYEGWYATPRGFQQHPEGTVNVNVRGDIGQQRDLILTSYEPVNWVLDVPDHVEITKIIVSGYHKSRVTNVPSGTDVEYRSYEAGDQYYYAYQSSGDSYNKLKNWIAGMYTNGFGNVNAEYMFPGYSASSIDVYVGYKG